MILTPELEQQIIGVIEHHPTDSLILPSWAYGKDGRVVVLVDGLPIDLHRHLHNVMIRPLRYHERMFQNPGISPKNVNPYLFGIPLVGQSVRSHCSKGHAYAGNEAPPNSRGYRCLTCLRDSRKVTGAANALKTQCPQGHDYTPENTYTDGAGKRHCLTCKRLRNREYMRKLRASRKEKS